MAAGTIRAFYALYAFHSLGTLGPLRALDALGALRAFGTLGPVGAAAAAAPVVGVDPRHPVDSLGVPAAAGVGPHDAVAHLEAHARSGRVDAANAQPIDPGLGGELTRQIGPLGGG